MNVMVAVDNSLAGIKAMEYAAKLCQNLKSYNLYVVNIISLNPTTTMPYIDHLSTVYNIEIEEGAEGERKAIQAILDHLEVTYEFAQIEGESDAPGPILLEYLEESAPQLGLDLFLVGSRHKSTLEKLTEGSFSEYCLEHVSAFAPVCVVRWDTSPILKKNV
ncbi:hypothetical protein HDV03_004088 [Kappamyces sp. JEL0829]|nr:hypothetical protein HDV03_004088 [Kappamyces sp. JEL0829]